MKKKKISVNYHDPNVKSLKSRKLKSTLISKKLNARELKKYDCVIILDDDHIYHEEMFEILINEFIKKKKN